jgi:hypothetical protein
MEAFVLVLTLLGGVATLWFFWDKIAAWLSPNLLKDTSRTGIEKAILKSHPKTDWIRAQTNAKQVLSYRHNPALRFEMSHLDDGFQNRDFREPWANRHPDPSAAGYWCDLYFGEALIERFILVGVDGVRAHIPPPRREDGTPGGDSISTLDYKVAQIHDSLNTLDEYIRRSGLRVANAA